MGLAMPFFGSVLVDRLAVLAEEDPADTAADPHLVCAHDQGVEVDLDGLRAFREQGSRVRPGR